MSHTIPHTIHYIWFGPHPKPQIFQKCLASWRTHLPDWEIIEWNESNWDVNDYPFTAQAAQEQKWAFVSDFARLEILYRHGGIYMDTDVEIISNPSRLLEHSCFFGMESPQNLGCALIGSSAKHPTIKAMCEVYKKPVQEYIPIPYLLTPYLLTPNSTIGRDAIITTPQGVTLFGQDYCYPFSPSEVWIKNRFITRNTISVHHYQGSWVSPKKRVVIWGRNLFRLMGIHSIRSFLGLPIKKERISL